VKKFLVLMLVVMVGVVLVSVPVAWAADVEAKVQSVDESGQWLTLDTGLKLMIPANVKVDRKALQPGTPVKLSYDFDTQRSANIVTSIEVPAPPKQCGPCGDPARGRVSRPCSNRSPEGPFYTTV